MPRQHRRVVRDTWVLIDQKLGAFVRGQLILIVFVALLLSAGFWAIGLPYWILIGSFAGVFEIVPVIGPLVAGALAVGVGLTQSSLKAAAAGGIVLAVRMLEDYVVIPKVLGHATGLSPLVVLVSVSAVGILFGGFYVLLAIPIAAVLATLVDVVVRDVDPAEQDVPGRALRRPEGRSELALALRQRPNTRPPSVKPSPNVPTANPPIATALRPAESRCQRPSASCSSGVSSSPRRCLRSAPPARSPRYRSSKISDESSAIAFMNL